MPEVDNTNSEGQGAPPYISFRTLLNLIERMANESTPPRIDRSYLVGLSGGYQSQVMAALRSLGLTDEDGRVQQRLVDLVERPQERKDLLATIFEERYPEAVRLGKVNATQGQLEEEFRKMGISGATLRKAVAFFLHGADFAGIPLSPFFKTPATSEGRAAPKRRRTRTTKMSEDSSAATRETATVTKHDELRTRYIEMLMNRVAEQEQIDDKLLDRIEALLGYRAGRQPDEGERED